MLKIETKSRRNLFRAESRYVLSRGDRVVGQIVDAGNEQVFELELEDRQYRIERTEPDPAEGFLGKARQALYTNWAGNFRLVDLAGKTLATAKQPREYEFYVTAGRTHVSVVPGEGRRQKWSVLIVTDDHGNAIGELKRGPWRISGKSDWLSSLPDHTDPIAEALLLWLYVKCEARREASTT